MKLEKNKAIRKGWKVATLRNEKKGRRYPMTDWLVGPLVCRLGMSFSYGNDIKREKS